MLQHFLRRWKPLITIIFKAADNNTYLRPLSFCPRRMLKRERKWNQSYRLQAKSGYTGRGTSLLPWNFSVSRLAEIFKSPFLRHICGIRAVSRVVLWTALFFIVQDYLWQTAGRILDETTLCNRFQNSNDLHSQNTDHPWIRTINPEKIAKNACISGLFILN